jgi:MFS family permease
MNTRDDSFNPLAPDARAGTNAGRDVRDDRLHPGGDVRDVRTPGERAALRGDGPAGAGGGESIAELLKALRDESATLMRQELALARTEISEKAAKAGRNAAYTGAGAVLAYAGAFFVLSALAVAMALLINRMGADPHGWWLGPLLVGAIVGIVGAVLTSKGIRTLKEQSLVPEKTVQTLREDKQWLQEKVTQ